MSETKSPHVIHHQGLAGPRTIGTPELWSFYSFAPEWFNDALQESRLTGHAARRREILFSVCCAESYIFEWVRDEVLQRDPNLLSKYFKPGVKRGVKEKFRDVPKDLKRDGYIVGTLDCSTATWNKFRTLVDYRDGLVHARASRPYSAKLTGDEKPLPTKQNLDSYPPGEAVETVRRLIQKLHEDTRTKPLTWLKF
jgi:hypothetical protein